MRTPGLCALLALPAAVIIACSGSGGDAPWNTMPTADGHSSSFFPIAAGTAHDVTGGGTSCDGCHSPQSPTFAQFDCVGCHTDATTTPHHSGVNGYRWASDACYGCHPQGTADSVDHAGIFPIRGAGVAHAEVACAQCHVDPSDRRNVDCATCHTQSLAVASKHGAVADYASYADTAGCLRCHGDSQVNRVASHDSIISREEHASWCITCHPGMRSDKTWAADWNSRGCVACHGTNDPDGD